MRLRAGFGFFLSVCLCACNGSSDSSDDDGDTSGSNDSGGPELIEEADISRRLAETECKWLFDCDCVDRVEDYEGEADCVETLTEGYERSFGSARNAALIYDPYCAQELIDDMDDIGCGVESVQRCDACSLYHGGHGEAASCIWLGGHSECEQRLRCDGESSTCYSPCNLETLVRDGEQCATDRGTPVAGCEPESICDAESHTCVPLPGPDQPCYEDELCTSAAWCITDDPDGPLCAAKRPEGEACTNDDQCQSGFCTGECSLPLGPGETCGYSDLCADGFECIEEVCADLRPLVCR